MKTKSLLKLVGVALTCLMYGGALAETSARKMPESQYVAPSPEKLVSITATSNGAAKSVIIQLPVGTEPNTITAVLNGKSVSARFNETPCDGGTGVCLSAALSEADGMRAGKNVLYAVAKKPDGTLVSSRLRFAVSQDASKLSSARYSTKATALDTGGITATNFLPPSVALNTTTPGGWLPGSPWFQIGGQTYPMYGGDDNCSPQIYFVVVLDRQTLQEVPGTEQCVTSASALNYYLGTIPPNAIVVAGTISNATVDPGLDTTPIGGTKYLPTTPQALLAYPRGYMIIGAGGAAPGSAYENYYSLSSGQVPTFATGTMVEDVNGNYNFQSGGAVEYTVSPNDPNYSNASVVTLLNVGTYYRYSSFNWPGRVVFSSPAGQTNGYWMLKLQRDNLDFDLNCGATGNPSKLETDIQGCGAFYPTGSSNAEVATNAYQSLAAALNAVTPNDLVFLVTVGAAAYSGNQSAFDVANTSFTDGNSVQHNAYYQEFDPALSALGGTPETTLSLSTPGSSYSFVTCLNCGNSLTGHSILSTSVYSQQGQTGYIHGIVQRSLNGLFWPTRASQESFAENAAGAGADFTMNLVEAQQPVEWPELSNNLLSGASTVTGQVAAYHYISYELLTQYYMKGALGDYLDDIHYYFTGSNNTYIDYHTFDPVALSFPGQAGACYTWTDPVPAVALDCFTQQDFSAVSQQLSSEIINLDNVLLFMVNGSTNMKDIVATGNGSAALALIGAAAEVEGSSLQPPPATQLTVNYSNILNLVSNVVNVGLSLASDGIVDEDTVDEITEFGSTLSGLVSGASSVTGGLYAPGAKPPLPSPDETFQTTIAGLANSALQQQFTAGFDTELDSILGDYGKLSAIGPLITNSNNKAFYAPNQIEQSAAVALLGQGSQRSYMMSLLPAFYAVQYYPTWPGNNPGPNYPDMGGYVSGATCNTWYAWSPQPPPFVSTWYPAYAGNPHYWPEIVYGSGTTDFYVIGGAAKNPGQTNQSIPFIDSQVALTLFSATQLNIPLDAFVAKTGPMASAFLDTTVNGFDNFPRAQTCSANHGIGVGAAPPPPSPDQTTTTTAVPSTAVLGDNAILQATVTSPAGVPQGTVNFYDGSVSLGSVKLDATGNASFTATGLSLGSHSIVAYYPANDPYYPSSSAASPLTVYANAPDIVLSLSVSTVPVTYGTSSTAINMQATSQYGLTGTVSFSCTGLPSGMACNFNPATTTIAAGGNASTSFTIASTGIQAAGSLWPGRIGILLLPFSLLCLWRINKGGRKMQPFLRLLLLSAATLGGTLGCGGNSKPQAVQETGAKTVLVNATIGSTTKTIPLVLNIQ
jgi:hypothetical protein